MKIPRVLHSERAQDRLAVVGLLALTLLLTRSFWLDPFSAPAPSLDPDALQQLSFAYSIHDAVSRHGEFPLWNPYLGGGIPWAGFHYNPGLSLVTPFHLLFGELLGVKVLIWAALFLGGLACHLTLRSCLGLAPLPSALAGGVYATSCWMPARMRGGGHDEIVLFLVPLAVYLFCQLARGRLIGLLLPLLYSAAFAQAKFTAFLFAFVALLSWYALRPQGPSFATRPAWAPSILVLSFAVGVLLSLAKLLPLLDLVSRDLVDQQAFPAVGYSSGRALLRFIFEASEPARNNLPIGIGLHALLAVVAIGLDPRVGLRVGAIAVVAALFALGSNSPIPLYRLTEDLPIFSMMRSYAKYWNSMVLFGLCLLIGVGYASIFRLGSSLRSPRAAALVCMALFGVLVFPSARSSTVIFDGLFSNPRVVSDHSEPFHHVAIASLEGTVDRYRFNHTTQPALNQYYHLKRGIGMITWYGNLVFPENVTPKYRIGDDGVPTPNREYQGEVYCVPGNCRGELEGLSYNQIHVLVEVPEGGSEVVINFNHDERWSSSVGRVISHEGLLAVAGLPPGLQQVHLRFRDGLFSIGLAIASTTLVMWLWMAPRLFRRIAEGPDATAG